MNADSPLRVRERFSPPERTLPQQFLQLARSPKTQAQPARPAPEKLDQVKLELRNILTILNRRC